MKKLITTKDWLPIEEVEENGIVRIKNQKYIKIIKIIPVNFYLKSELEKLSILNSYKVFLKSCNFDIQIIIQSKKENNIESIIDLKEKDKESTLKINELYKKYINYIEYINSNEYICSKNYFIIIKYDNTQYQNKTFIKQNEMIIEESLKKCGNAVIVNLQKEEIEEILKSFFNL